MAKKKYSIEEYIKAHLGSIPKLNPSQRIHAAKANTDFSAAVSTALGKMASSSAKHGLKAERLSGLGLGNSGYSDYVEKLNESNFKKELQKASDKRIYDTEEAISNASYKSAAILSLEDKLSSYAIKNDLSDKDSLNAYANILGILPERLDSAVENAIAANERHKRDKNFDAVHKNIVQRRLTKHEAYQYALSLGLSEEDATKLGEIAYKINESLGE